MRNLPVSYKKGWETLGGKTCFFKSRWESVFAKYIEWQRRIGCIKDWSYEPETFWFKGVKRGCVSYKPDFKVTEADGSHYWVEIKGYMDAKSATKIKRFRKYFPNEKLYVLQKEWFLKDRGII